MPLKRRTGPGTVVFVIVVAAFLSFFLIYPLGLMLKRAFVVDGRLTLGLFGGLWRDPNRFDSIRNSLVIGAVVTVACGLLAAPLALLSGRYTFRGKKWLTGAILVPMIMPPFVGAIGMRQMLARNGTFDILLVKALSKIGLVAPETMGLVDLTEGGIIAVIILETLHLYPIMYLNLAAALANVDPSLEEAARNLGASSRRLFRTVTLPLMMPGLFAGSIIVFIWAFTDLGTPLVFHFQNVIPVQIFNDSKAVNENPAAFAMVVLVVVLAAGAFILSKRLAGRRAYHMLSKDTRGARAIRLGRRGTALAYLLFGGVTAVALLPHLSVVLMSISKTWLRTAFPSDYTLAWFKDIFSREDTLIGIRNSIFYSTGSTLVDVLVGVGLAYVLARGRIFGKGWLDTVAMMPLAIPGFVLAFGYVAAFVGSSTFRWLDPFLNPTLLLMVSYSVRRLPFMVRSVYAGFQQVSPSLEEASLNLGATPGRTLRKITVPLVSANILAGAMLCFSFAMLEVSDSLILASEKGFYPITKVIYALSMDIQRGPNLAAAMGMLGMALLVLSLLVAGRILGERMGELFRA